MNKTQLLFHNMENTFKSFLVKLFFKKSTFISPSKIDLAKIKKILIVRQHDPMGDVLISTAIIPNLEKAFPAAEMDVIARPALSEKDIFLKSPFINEVIVFSKKEFFFPWKMGSFIRYIREKKYDLAIVAGSSSVSFTSLFLAYMSGTEIRAGYSGEYFGKKLYTDTFLTTPVPYDSSIIKHQVIRNLDILTHINVPITSKCHYMSISEEEKKVATERMNNKGIVKPGHTVIGMHLGANELPNRWPLERFAETGDFLTKNPKVKVIVFYGPKEKELADKFRKIVKSDVVIQDYLPLREFASMLSLLDVFICNDTGVLHVAAAVGTKTVAIFGPTDPTQWNPLGAEHIWLRKDDKSVLSVGTDEVLSKVKELLGK